MWRSPKTVGQTYTGSPSSQLVCMSLERLSCTTPLMLAILQKTPNTAHNLQRTQSNQPRRNMDAKSSRLCPTVKTKWSRCEKFCRSGAVTTSSCMDAPPMRWIWLKQPPTHPQNRSAKDLSKSPAPTSHAESNGWIDDTTFQWYSVSVWSFLIPNHIYGYDR